MANNVGYGALGAQLAVLDTELNSLASGAYSAVSDEVYDNTATAALLGAAELAVTFGSAPTAGTTCDLFLLDSQDGTAYPDGGGAVAPAGNLYVGSFVLRAVTTAQLVHIPSFPFPSACKGKFVLLNNSGVAFPASGSTVKVVASKLNNNL